MIATDPKLGGETKAGRQVCMQAGKQAQIYNISHGGPNLGVH